jgi:Ca2+-binding RTX toxin-like protein
MVRSFDFARRAADTEGVGREPARGGRSARRSLRLGFVVLALVAAQAALAAAPAFATDHNIRIREVFAGASTGKQQGAQFIELQLANGGQGAVTGNRVHVYDDSGAVLSTHTFTADLANSQNQRSILVATSRATTFFGVAADLTMPAPTIQRAGGQVCYEDVDDATAGFRDCVAWGSFTGASPSPTGNPFQPVRGLPDGMSIERDISAGDPNLLETGPGGGPGGDDTDDSAADFFIASPSPRNNAGAVTTTAGVAAVDGGGELRFDAASGVKNRLTVAPTAAFWRVTDRAAPIEAGAGCEQATVNRVLCPLAPVTSLAVNGGDLNDHLKTPHGIDATVDGGAGDDRITTGDGSDSLIGGPGRDLLDGGPGPDVFDGGDNRDTVTYERRTAGQPVVVDIDGAVGDDGGAIDEDGSGMRDSVLTSVENVKGGAGDDLITGSDGPNRLVGGPGADQLHGLGANDLIRAQDGESDEITCGPGPNDRLFADPIDVFPADGPDACETVVF